MRELKLIDIVCRNKSPARLWRSLQFKVDLIVMDYCTSVVFIRIPLDRDLTLT